MCFRHQPDIKMLTYHQWREIVGGVWECGGGRSPSEDLAMCCREGTGLCDMIKLYFEALNTPLLHALESCMNVHVMMCM